MVTGIILLSSGHCEALLLFVNALDIAPHAAYQLQYAG